jgi:phage shock protein C
MNYRPFNRSKNNKIIAGICGGLGEYFGIDPILVRVIFLTLLLFGGGGGILYLILLLLTPKNE